MIRSLCLLLLFGSLIQPLGSYAQEIESVKARKYTIYIVRHGEKLGGNDPELSEAGKKRAGDLYRFLQNKKIDIIYSTPFKRTMMTGDSLRIYQGIDTLLYKADATGNGYTDAASRNLKKHETILIIAHSNTIGTILRKLGAVDQSFRDLEDNEYNHIYKLDFDDGKLKFEKMEYGAPNPVLPTGGTMKTGG